MGVPKPELDWLGPKSLRPTADFEHGGSLRGWVRYDNARLNHMSTITTKPLIEAPASTDSVRYETLAYLDAYDAVLNCDYAFVAYRETDSGGAWRVRIRSSQTAGAVFEPMMIALQARSTGAQGKPWFMWGYNFEPSASDLRQVEFRVHVAGGKPAEVEMLVRLRNFDHTAGEARSVRFPWPKE